MCIDSQQNNELTNAFLFLVGLGTDHYTVSWEYSNMETNILVVGVHDATTVQMTLPRGFGSITAADGLTYSSSQTITVRVLTIN